MEYYIMKFYEWKNKEAGIRLGINRFSKCKKIIVISLLILMVLLFFGMIVLMTVLPNPVWFPLGSILCVLAVLTLLILDNRDRRINAYQHVKEYNKKIDILDDILKTEFSIDSANKIDILINKYQGYIDKQTKDDKKKNKIIFTLFTALAGVLSTSFLNLDVIGIDFLSWLSIAMFLLLIIGFVSALIYCYRSFDTLRQKYETMINDLQYVKLRKYNN